MKVGDTFCVNGEVHVIIKTDGDGNNIHSEPLKDYICRTRLITHHGQKMSVKEMLESMCDSYIKLVSR